MAKYRSYFWFQNRIAVRIIGPIHERVKNPYRTGINVMDCDWDNLIVLDACRADLFEEAIELDQFESYDVIQSIGSTSGQWYNRTFAGDGYGDTVIVTANPHASIDAPDKFHDLIEVDLSVIECDEIGESIYGYHPEDVHEAAIETFQRYDDKRLIIHFMQPHIPFLATPELIYRRYKDEKDHDFGGKSDPIHVFEALAHKRISFGEFWHGYKENLLLAFEYGSDLAGDLGGKTVFTADHGNMLGERTWPIPIRLYGHPRGIRSPQNVNVPWAERVEGDRREIVVESVDSSSRLEKEEITNRLQALGYKA